MSYFQIFEYFIYIGIFNFNGLVEDAAICILIK